MVDFKYYLNRQGVRGQRGEKGDTGYSPVITEKTNTSTEYVLHIQNETDETSFDTPNLKEGLIPEDLGGTVVRYNRETGKQYYGEIDNATEEVAGIVKLEPDETILEPVSETSVITASQVLENYTKKTETQALQDTVTLNGQAITALQDLTYVSGVGVLGTDLRVTKSKNGETVSVSSIPLPSGDVTAAGDNVFTGGNTFEAQTVFTGAINAVLIESEKIFDKSGNKYLNAVDCDGTTIEVTEDGKLHVIGGGTDIDNYVVSATMDADCSVLSVSSIEDGATTEKQYLLGNVYAKKEDAVQYNVETGMGSDTVKEIKVTGDAANLKLSALGTNATSEKEASIELQSANTSATGVNGVFIKTTELASDKGAGVVGLYLGGETTPVCLAGEGGNFKIFPNPRTSRTMGLEMGDDSLVFRKADNTTVDLLTGGGGTNLVAGDNITLEELSDGSTKISATGKLSVDVIDGGDSTTVNALVTLANSSGNVIAQYNGQTEGGEYNDIA